MSGCALPQNAPAKAGRKTEVPVVVQAHQGGL